MKTKVKRKIDGRTAKLVLAAAKKVEKATGVKPTKIQIGATGETVSLADVKLLPRGGRKSVYPAFFAEVAKLPQGKGKVLTPKKATHASANSLRSYLSQFVRKHPLAPKGKKWSFALTEDFKVAVRLV